MAHILIVDDDADAAMTLAELIGGEGLTSATAGTLKEARQQLVLREPDIVLLDVVLPDGSGMDLFDDLKRHPNVEIILITGHASLETSIQALRLGAADYLIKPFNHKQLLGILNRIRQPILPKARLGDLANEAESMGRFGQLWGSSPAMQQVYHQIARVAGTAVTVLVTGESGTGKEVVAQTLHELSRRRNGPFLGVNCGAISPQLIESEMFGHEKGSFTGANRQHRGYFERAHGGTLLLDEVTEMPLELQVKLLRVLETGAFSRVGSDEVIETSVRIVAATNRVPREAVAAGKLREDLFYRLNVFAIALPPLRQRSEDIPVIAQHFLDEFNREEEKTKHFAPGFLQHLASYHWPGNVRELRNAVHHAYIMTDGSSIEATSLAFETPARSEELGPVITVKVGTPIAEVERRLILATLDHVGGKKELAAEVLGVSTKTLYNRLSAYGRGE